MSAGAETLPHVYDVGDTDFEARVIERSKTVPVLIDFWAPWCGPCHQLAPVLEKLVQEYEGAFELARVNIDEAVATASAFQVQSIPLVIGVRDGRAVGEFQGVQPEAVVRQLCEALVPSEAAVAAERAARLLAEGAADEALALADQALALDSRHAAALLVRATVLGERGDVDLALTLLERGVPDGELAREYERLRARLRTKDAAADAGALEELSRAAAAGGPAERLTFARALVAAEDYEAALAELLAVVEADAGPLREDARRAMLDVFAVLPPGDPRTDHFRRQLGRALFR